MISPANIKYSVVKVFSVCILTLILPLLVSQRVNASDWSWTNQQPTIVSSVVTSYMNQSYCATPHKIADIYSEIGQKSVCLSENEYVSFGEYYSQYWGGYTSTVKMRNDSKMHLLRAGCGQYDSCLYLPEKDILVYKQNINGIARALVLYRNFSKRLKFVTYGIYQEYSFDNSNPDYIYNRPSGSPWPINGVGASKNGKWLAIEVMTTGFVILNTDTLETKRISTVGYRYDVGMDPSPEISVSNDGEHVAIMGTNSGIHIFDVSPDCGDTPDESLMTTRASITHPCKEAVIDYGGIISHFFAALSPRFDESGGELNFFALSSVGEAREVTMRTNGNVGKKIEYLALGDSFTSGEGETDDKYYLNGTNDQYDKCHVSNRSYPFLIANLQNISGDFVKSVACSGAVMGDVVGENDDYLGQGERLGINGLNLVKIDRTVTRALAKETFQPGRVYQEAFVERYKPGVITVSIGGNNAGLMGKLSTCITPGTCSWVENPEKREQTALEIKRLFSKLVNTYKKLHADSPNSKIYAIGYPKIIDPNGQCDVVIGAMFNDSERNFMNEGIIYLNQVIQAAARAAGIGYIDISDSFGNHTLCGSGDPVVMNTIRTGDDISYAWIINIGNESLHPTPDGHRMIADKINSQIGDLSSYEYCNNQALICSDSTITAPEPSAYWIPDGYHDYPETISSQFLADSGQNNNVKDIELPEYSFAPNSDVRVEITSTARELGQYTANADGSLSATVELPTDLEYGYHTVHLYGTSYSGDPIELYQIIEYREKIDKPVADIPDNASENNTPPTDPAQSDNPATEVAETDTNNPATAATLTPDIEDKITTSQIVQTSDLNLSKPEVKGVAVASKTDQTSPENLNSDSFVFKYWKQIFAIVIPVIIAAIISVFIIIKKRSGRDIG